MPSRPLHWIYSGDFIKQKSRMVSRPLWKALSLVVLQYLSSITYGVDITEVRDCPNEKTTFVATDYNTANINSQWLQWIKQGVTRACNQRTRCCTKQLAANSTDELNAVLSSATDESLTVATGFLFGSAMDSVSTDVNRC